MKVIDPIPLEIKFSSIAETDEQDGVLWSATATYAAETKVRQAGASYVSLKDDNRGNDPARDGLYAKPNWWQKLGATNRSAVLDAFMHTQTVAPDEATEITIRVNFTRATGFALLNIDAAEVEVKITDNQGLDGPEIVFSGYYDLTEDLTSFSAWAYCFEPIIRQGSVLETEIPIVLDGELEVVLRGRSEARDLTAIGLIVVGRSYFVGSTCWDVSIGETDYSRIVTSDLGVTNFVLRNTSRTARGIIFVPPENTDATFRLLDRLRSKPALWNVDNYDSRMSNLVIWGYRKEFELTHMGPNQAEFSFQIQGLI